MNDLIALPLAAVIIACGIYGGCRSISKTLVNNRRALDDLISRIESLEIERLGYNLTASNEALQEIAGMCDEIRAMLRVDLVEDAQVIRHRLESIDDKTASPRG